MPGPAESVDSLAVSGPEAAAPALLQLEDRALTTGERALILLGLVATIWFVLWLVRVLRRGAENETPGNENGRRPEKTSA